MGLRERNFIDLLISDEEKIYLFLKQGMDPPPLINGYQKA